jgi:hypothetical protein
MATRARNPRVRDESIKVYSYKLIGGSYKIKGATPELLAQVIAPALLLERNFIR